MIINYPKQWQFLINQFGANQMAHAYLLSGRDFSSINRFATEFAKLINCLQRQTGKEPCQHCQNCRLIAKNFFPDLMLLKSADSPNSLKNQKDMMEISIEQARDAQNFLSYKSYYGKFKTVIIENAQRMSLEAQNCFLKTLEEPKGKTLLILIAAGSSMLLPTVLSRCQEIKFLHQTENKFSEEEMKIAKDLNLLINSSLAEKFLYVKNAKLEGANLIKMLEVFQKYFRSLMLAKIGIIKRASNGPDEYSTEKLKKIIKLIENISYQASVTNINQKLALELLMTEI